MSKREAITRYSLIIKKVEKHPCTFEEINDYLDRQSDIRDYDFTVSKRTFQRDLDEIRSIFEIDIQFDFSRKVYFVAESEGQNTQQRLLEAFDTFNALNVAEGVSKYIHFEQRRPQGTEHLYGLLHAIKNSQIVKFEYYSFAEQTITQRMVEPYLLKEARNRWYIVAKELNGDTVKTFGLDRISELEITKRKFKRSNDLQLATMFHDSFGIIDPEEEKPQTVVLSFTKFEGQYIKSYPLHHSQAVRETDQEVIVELYIKLTYDFRMELLSYGEEVQVLQPKLLADEIMAIHKSAVKMQGKIRF